jgi:hypothetical protein
VSKSMRLVRSPHWWSAAAGWFGALLGVYMMTPPSLACLRAAPAASLYASTQRASNDWLRAQRDIARSGCVAAVLSECRYYSCSEVALERCTFGNTGGWQ